MRTMEVLFASLIVVFTLLLAQVVDKMLANIAHTMATIPTDGDAK